MIDIKKAQSLPPKVIFQNVLVYVLPVITFIAQALITGASTFSHPSSSPTWFYLSLFLW